MSEASLKRGFGAGGGGGGDGGSGEKEKKKKESKGGLQEAPEERRFRAAEEDLLMPPFEVVKHAERWGMSEDKYQRLQAKKTAGFKKIKTSWVPKIVLNIPGIVDEPGFAAAGVLLWRDNPKNGSPEVLMAIEDRWDRRKGSCPPSMPDLGPGRGLNFIGGCRDADSQAPREVAIREMIEETAGGLSANELDLKG
ncbi:hypothetical protein T484DRAFT_1902690 [Baffinella frigidus]|nr:hypothetical protein T484DRAFT_1902690 [Cryptophyta sp. CCMP2293]